VRLPPGQAIFDSERPVGSPGWSMEDNALPVSGAEFALGRLRHLRGRRHMTFQHHEWVAAKRAPARRQV
jgi:hypothetical protein